MRDIQRYSFLFAVSLLVLNSGVGQPTPPHEVYGEVTDSGAPAEGIEVKAVTSSEVFSSITDGKGYYRVQVPNEYSSFNLTVEEVRVGTNISVNSGMVEEYSIEGDFIDNSSEDGGSSGGSSGGGPSGGPSGGRPPQASGPGRIPSSAESINTSRSVRTNFSNDSGEASAVIENISSNQKVDVEVSDSQRNFSVEEVSFSTSSVSSSGGVEVSVQDLKAKPEEVDDAGNEVYMYQEINVSGVSDEEVASANISFRVNKSFVDDNERTVEDVVMKRYSDGWNELPTRFREETANAYRFVANSEGFSYYAVALRNDENSVQQNPDQQTEPSNRSGEQVEERDQETPLIPIALSLAFLLLLVLVVSGRKGRDNTSDPNRGVKEGVDELKDKIE